MNVITGESNENGCLRAAGAKGAGRLVGGLLFLHLAVGLAMPFILLDPLIGRGGFLIRAADLSSRTLSMLSLTPRYAEVVFWSLFRLAPRWLAEIGDICALMQIGGTSVRGLLGLSPKTRLALLVAPIYVFMAVWPMARGFRPGDRDANQV